MELSFCDFKFNTSEYIVPSLIVDKILSCCPTVNFKLPDKLPSLVLSINVDFLFVRKLS